MRGAVGTLLQTGDQFTEIAADPSPGLQGKNGVIKENAHNTTNVGLSISGHARKGMLIGGNSFPGTAAPGETGGLLYSLLYKQFPKE